ncbi:MAG: LptF/LptG family permease [Verrucomicrobiae bacterium]|nr:LptF/LptG family permease [Verrucomicrobiae bacterium]
MKLLDRYIGRQVLLSAFFAVVVLSIILVMGSIFKYILSQLVDRPDLDLGFVAKLLLNVLPFSLAITIPWGFLTAILLVFGRLSADNELVSLRMAGLSMPRICLSVALLGVIFTCLCGWIKLQVEPDARARLERMLPDMLYNLAAKNPRTLFTDRQVMDEIDGYLIYAHKEGDYLTHFEMAVLDRFSRPEIFVTAERVEVTLDPDSPEPAMLMKFHNAHFEHATEGAKVDEIRPFYAEISNMSVPLTKLKKTQEKVKPETLRNSQLARELHAEGLSKDDRSSLRTEISMRYSFALACVTLGLIGVPFAITAQRRETSVGFAMSLLIGIVYFLLMTIVEMVREKHHLYPELLAWVPNVIFVAIGLMLFRRLAKK